MDHLPIFLDIRGKTVVVAGGGALAARRVERALERGRQGEAVRAKNCPRSSGPFKATMRSRFSRALPRPPTSKARSSPMAPRRISSATKRLRDLAKAAGVLANVADTMELCDFITPAILDRTPDRRRDFVLGRLADPRAHRQGGA